MGILENHSGTVFEIYCPEKGILTRFDRKCLKNKPKFASC
jgi:hypothetical protein